MTSFKKVLMGATAFTLVTGMAFAQSNEAHNAQNGTGNVFDVDQSTGTGDNDVGSAADPVNQTGNNNLFIEDNSGLNVNFPSGNNDVNKAEQIGSLNIMSSTYNGAGSNNTIENAQQIGDSNRAVFFRNSSTSDGTIGTVLQRGSRNSLRLQQEVSSGNTITLVRQIGNDNRFSAGTATSEFGTFIQQRGSGNTVDESSILGDDNAPSSLNGQGNTHRIIQIGNNNGNLSSTAITRGSGGNRLNIAQNGNSNNFDVRQGVDVASTGNDVRVMQDGSFNDVVATQYGSNNALIVDQNADQNTVTANFRGNDNGVGTLSGAAGDLLTASGGLLVQGTIFQDSSTGLTGNTVDYNVTGSGNLFAFAQIGGGNTITGTVGSNGNQAAVLQQGDGNNASFVQTGGMNNVVSIDQ